MNLKTEYMGLELDNPLVPSASPLSQNVDDIRKLEDAGAPALVMFSIFEEQIRHDQEALDYHLSAGTESFAESLSYFPDLGDYNVGSEAYLELVQKAVEAVDIPIIGSLNGVTKSGWIDYARKLEQTGIKGLELNIYYIPTHPEMSSESVEKRYVDVLKAVKDVVNIPVAVKLSPFFSSTANMVSRLEDAGADALVLFNRFYQPDLDLDKMEVSSTLNLSGPEEMLLPLRWIAILSAQNRKASLAASTGVHCGIGAAKLLLAGADVVMSTSSLLKNGIGHLSTMLDGLRNFMAAKEYASVEEMKGAMNQRSVENPTAFERANYIKVLEDYKAKYTM